MKIAVIIPAYNEEKTVADVVSVARSTPYIDEVIVVNDASLDSTSEVARRAGAKVIDLEENAGKGGAIAVGVSHTDADVVLLLDGDLIGLTPEHIGELVNDVISGEADMTVGLFGQGRFSTDVAQKLAPWLSGQRAVKRDILDAMSDMDVSRFGVEIALTKYAKKNCVRVKPVVLHHCTHVMKEEKMGYIKGFAARLKMYGDIVKTLLEISAKD